MNEVISASDNPKTLFGKAMKYRDTVDFPDWAENRIFGESSRDSSDRKTTDFNAEEKPIEEGVHENLQNGKEEISNVSGLSEVSKTSALTLDDFSENAEIEKQQVSGASSEQFGNVLSTVEQKFPDLRKLVELAMSVVATLALEDLDKCPTAFLEGRAGAGKTTILKFFYPSGSYKNGLKLAYKSDDFTPASFVSMDASKKSKNLKNVDLLPRIKDKVFLTPDANTIFERGGEDEARNALSTVTRVLDGEGYSRDAGTHGQRGYSGDYKFVWLGATTPLKDWHYRMMGNLGSRILMTPVEDGHETAEEAAKEVIKGDYKDRVKECRKAVSGYFNDFFGKNGIRKVKFDKSQIPKNLWLQIGKFGKFIADFRRKNERENPKRVISLLIDIARGHALLNGRKYLKQEDVDMLIPLVYGSVPKIVQGAFKCSLKYGKITVKALASETDWSKPTALEKMKELDDDWNLIYRHDENTQGGEKVVGEPVSGYDWIEDLQSD